MIHGSYEYGSEEGRTPDPPVWIVCPDCNGEGCDLETDLVCDRCNGEGRIKEEY